MLANKEIQKIEEAMIQAAFLKSKGVDSGAQEDTAAFTAAPEEEEGDIIF